MKRPRWPGLTSEDMRAFATAYLPFEGYVYARHAWLALAGMAVGQAGAVWLAVRLRREEDRVATAAAAEILIRALEARPPGGDDAPA